MTLPFALAVVAGVAWAATDLHRVGLAHGDIYGHNILVSAGTGDASAAGGSVDEPTVVLSDLGAAYFYDRAPIGGGPSGGGGGFNDGHLIERIEVLAFGHLVSELLARISDAELAADPPTVQKLHALAKECALEDVGRRPSFQDLSDSCRGFLRS
jgi:serine/threonine protein kinase